MSILLAIIKMKQDVFKNISLCPRLVLRSSLLRNVDIYVSKSYSYRTKTHYETLNISSNCTFKEIREAFIVLSKRYHPDKNAGSAKAQEQFVKVKEAYNILIKPQSRRQYDLMLHQYRSYPRNYDPYKTEFNEAYRRYYYYDEPWNDPYFKRNRQYSYSNDDSYYGVKGIKRQSNEKIASLLILLFVIIFTIHIYFIRMSIIQRMDALHKRSEENRQILTSVKERAEYFGTRERQIEALRHRLNNDS